jgi:hypothetical protein
LPRMRLEIRHNGIDDSGSYSSFPSSVTC